ncbi:luciferin 4-monooxygenase-like isoform X2 [Pieris brassicae]|uniref:luciferin 4-monooxygenase-like isoform X2 n=1 Tax=Pieris brassicae TaxID=7116 RepID=UPI001E65E611|nr:luciferin 4-monooxygenase-like isoform X2 [Pieris brassicae]
MAPHLSNDTVHWFMNELTSRIVSQSGNPSDRYHLGKIILQSLKDYPKAIMQIDGATGEEETNSSALQRIIECAITLRKCGIGIGDVIVLMAPSHLDLAIPLYAALCVGAIVSAVDRTLSVNELRATFEVSEPKIVFCQSEKATEVQIALNDIEQNTEIVTFDSGDYLCSFQEFVTRYRDDSLIDDFEVADLDTESAGALLIATSGTTGLPKAAVATHKNFATSLPYVWSRSTTFPGPTHMALVGSPLQWLTAIMSFLLSPILKYIRLQTSSPLTQEHAYYLINTYKIVNVDTLEDIDKPNVPGELWLKGPCIFKEYHKNPEATAETFHENGWFKTGDMFYRDENFNYYFCERIKLLLKYKSFQISPVEVENVIRQHPGILDVAVTGLPDPECGDLPVACVVLRTGYEVSANNIKDMVQDSLSDSKRLRGGVVFLNEIPMTASTKVHRRKLKEIVMNPDTVIN